MRCPRCQASMTERDFVDSEATGLMWMRGWQCSACGWSISPLPEHNRRLRAAVLEQPSYGGLVLGGEAFTQYAFSTVA